MPDQELVERVTGRRLDPHTGLIYHLKFKPPPAEALERLIQRSDDTEAKLRNRLDTHHANVAAVLGYYKDITVEVLHPPRPCALLFVVVLCTTQLDVAAGIGYISGHGGLRHPVLAVVGCSSPLFRFKA